MRQVARESKLSKFLLCRQVLGWRLCSFRWSLAVKRYSTSGALIVLAVYFFTGEILSLGLHTGVNLWALVGRVQEGLMIG
jgi:hypothetical protein